MESWDDLLQRSQHIADHPKEKESLGTLEERRKPFSWKSCWLKLASKPSRGTLYIRCFHPFALSFSEHFCWELASLATLSPFFRSKESSMFYRKMKKRIVFPSSVFRLTCKMFKDLCYVTWTWWNLTRTNVKVLNFTTLPSACHSYIRS